MNDIGIKARLLLENCALTEHGVGLHERYWTHLFRTP